jgi:hypothetical protein
MHHWHPPFGDRRQEIVFIGSGMDRVAIATALDAALLGREDKFERNAWLHLPDPFPKWRRDAAG